MSSLWCPLPWWEESDSSDPCPLYLHLPGVATSVCLVGIPQQFCSLLPMGPWAPLACPVLLTLDQIPKRKSVTAVDSTGHCKQ